VRVDRSGGHFLKVPLGKMNNERLSLTGHEAARASRSADDDALRSEAGRTA
jgi:hypothetical protein